MHNYVSTCAGIRYILGNHCVCLVASVMSNSMPPYGLSPTRLLCPWDSPGKNSGVACHALLQGIFLTQELNPCPLDWKYGILTTGTPVCVCAKLLQLCLIPCDPMDCSPPGSSVHGILQARIVEWVDMFSSKGSS